MVGLRFCSRWKIISAEQCIRWKTRGLVHFWLKAMLDPLVQNIWFPWKIRKKSTEPPFSHELDFTSFEDFTSFLTFMMKLQMTDYEKRRCQMPCVLRFEPKSKSLLERKICPWYLLFIKYEIQAIKSKMN